jgi:PKD repeat protein
MHGIARMFTQSGRLDDLARVLAEADLEKTASKLGHNTHQMTWQLQNLIEQVVRYSEGSLPDWLSDWDDTGQVIVAGSGSDSAFRLFKKCMPAGQVTLGANQAEGAKNAGRHYFVLVEPTSKHQEGKMAFEDPVPGDGTAGISLNADLSWSGLSDIDDYEIHFGTTSEPPFVIQHQKRMYDPGPLDPETTYYWQIVANVDGAKHAGPVWSFTTASGEPRPEREVYCDLDAVNRGWGLELRSTEDGDTAATSIGGRRCRTNLDPETDHHMYFNVASWYADGGARPQLYVSVLYYDTGEGYLELTYNSRRNYYEKAGHVEMTGSDTWKEHTFKLEEIWFHGGQNGNSDLRISGGAGQPIYVDVVRVSDVSFEPALMGSFVADRHSGPAPHAVQFDARGSVHTGKVDIADYAWDFGDGQQASGPEVQHTYEQPGMYETTLTVTDDEGTVARASLQIDVGCFVSVSNLNRYSIGRLYTGGHYLNDRDYTITTMPPFLERSQGILPANGDKEAREAEWITFELADPCDVYVAYDPRIGMPPAWLDSFEKTEHVIELSDGAQDHAVLYRRRFAAGPVTLGSNYGNTSSSHYFLLFAPDCGDQPRPLRPLAAFDLDIERGVAPLEVQFDAGASSDPMGEGIVQYEWDFGDTTSDGAVTSHTFEKPGVFTVTLSVTDAEGLTAHAQLDIEVMSRAIVLHNPNRYGIQQFFPGLPIDDSGHPTIEQMPGHLYGTIGIVPSREDAERTESEWLTFELGQPADVYVAYDSRAVPCRNALPLVDNYLKALTKINHSSHYKSEAVELKTKLLRNAGRMQDALRFLLGSCKTWDQYEPIFGPTQETAADNPPVSPPRPVDLLTNITSYRGTDWTPNGPVSTLLDVAGEMSQLEPMLAFLEARLEQTDEDRKRFTHNVWKTMLLARLERYENAKEVIRKILDRHSTNEKSGRLPYQPLLWLDSEIHDKPELIEESLECCKLAAEGYKEASRRNSSGLMYRLAMRQADAGRRDAARDTFLRLATLSVESHHDSAYAEYQRQQHLHHAASGLAEIEFHREAYALASRFHHMDRPQNWGDHYLNRGKQLANKLAEEHPELKYHLTLAATPVGEDEIELVWSITREQWRHWNNETQFMPIRESESWLDGLKAEIQVSHWFNGSFRSIETVDASKQRHVVSAVKPNTLFLYRIVLKTEDNRIGFVSDLAVGVAGENLLAGDFETSPEGWYFSTAYRLEKTDPGPNRHAGRQPTARPLATGSQAMQIATGEEAVWASPAIETDSGQSYYIGGWVKLETGGGRVEMGRLALDSEDRPMMYSALTSDDRPGGWVYVNQRIHPADADLSYEDGPVIAKDTEADRIPKAQSSMRLQLLLDETEVLLDDLFVVAYERGEASLLDALPSAEKPLIDMTLFLDLIDRWSKLDNLDPGLAKAEDEKQSAESEDGS